MRVIAIVLVVAAALAVTVTLAEAADEHAESVDEVLARIRQELGLATDDPVDPDEVPPDLLEELGDAVMGLMAADPQQHEWMDTMMGGEDSETLAAAHRWMAYRYLSGGYATMMGPGSMMGGGMMGSGMMGMGEWDRSPYDAPEEIARRRYAAGAISREEFLQLLEDLRM